MSPIEKEVIRRKMTVIVENLKALEAIKDMNIEEYKDDIFRRKATERLLQELIEAAIDINTHLIVQTGKRVPDDYFESFVKTGEYNINPKDLAVKLAPSAGLRNRLVHEYDVLEHAIVLEAVNTTEDLYPKYIKAIEDYLRQMNT